MAGDRRWGKTTKARKQLPLPKLFTVTHTCPYLYMLILVVSTPVFHSNTHNADNIYLYRNLLIRSQSIHLKLSLSFLSEGE